jgi:hypothetical protein
VSQPRDTLRELLEFLGARNRPRFLDLLLDEGQLPRVNEAGDKGRALIPRPTWSDQLRRQTTELVQPDAERMLAYMGKPADTWTW